MRDFCGTLSFFIAAWGTFRLVYGAWPPMKGNFGQWLLADSRAKWAMAAGLLAGMIGAIIVRAFCSASSTRDGGIREVDDYLRRGLACHEERRTDEAIDMFKRAIALALSAGRKNEAAPAYASLGKVYFDVGELS